MEKVSLVSGRSPGCSPPFSTSLDAALLGISSGADTLRSGVGRGALTLVAGRFGRMAGMGAVPWGMGALPLLDVSGGGLGGSRVVRWESKVSAATAHTLKLRRVSGTRTL